MDENSTPLPPIPTTDFGVEYPPLLEALDWSNCFSLYYIERTATGVIINDYIGPPAPNAAGGGLSIGGSRAAW